MEVVGSAVGIASLGIQVCQGLLSYYDSWKGYKPYIKTTYDLIDDLSRTLTLLKDSLSDKGLNEERRERVQGCINACQDCLAKLLQKLQKLQKYDNPKGLGQKAWSEMQRVSYPFRESTLVKLREIANDARERLQLALQVLQLNVSVSSQKTLTQVVAQTGEIVMRTANIETSVDKILTQNQRLLTEQGLDRLKKITDWLSPPDPWVNHNSARNRHEPYTGDWLIQSAQYQEWKAGSISHLWLYGNAGCGKTVLCSTAIEDIIGYRKASQDVVLVVFYFSFSDNQKQSYEDLLRSLVAQLGWTAPGQQILQQAFEKRSSSSIPGREELERIFLSSVMSHKKVFLMLDALDECPETNDNRQTVLDGLGRLSKKATNLKILATSRVLSDIGEAMEVELRADPISIPASSIDADIRKYVLAQLLRDRKLSRLHPTVRGSIEEKICGHAGGMFRWAYCQLQELKKLKSTKAKYIQEVLNSLPATLDETYERIFASIDERLRPEALTLLRWLAYAQSPLRLSELAEATIIDLASESVDMDDRGSPQDVLEILAELIVHENAKKEEKVDRGDGVGSDSEGSEDDDARLAFRCQRIDNSTKIRLAHFSVKEYLESKRIVHCNTKDFHLDSGKEHRVLAQSCLVYMKHYAGSSRKTTTNKDLEEFPLLRYAAESWYYHSLLQQSGSVDYEVSFLRSREAIRAWVLVSQPDRQWNRPFDRRYKIESSIYYASFVGLEEVVRGLIRAGSDVNVQGGQYGNALQAASWIGNEKVVQMLIDAGADVNTQGGHCNNALQAASYKGKEKVVQMLIDAGADVNAQGGQNGNTLQAALRCRKEKVVQMLMDARAGIRAYNSEFSHALQAASCNDNEKVVQMLIDAGADVNAQGGEFGNALQVASWIGNEKVVQMLIDAGADVNAQGGQYGNALQAALYKGKEKVVQMLMDAGADVNAQGGQNGNALQAASCDGNEKVVQMLIDAGADVNAQGGQYGNALQAALCYGNEKVVQMLIDAGADVNAQGGHFGNALQAASWNGNEKVVQMLIDAGADVNAQGGQYSNALQVASRGGHEKVVQMLIDAGADVNAQGGQYDNALQAALCCGHEKVVQMLTDAGSALLTSEEA